MVSYDFKKGDIIKVVLSGDSISIRCKYIEGECFETEIHSITGGEYHLFTVLSYSGSKKEKLEGGGRLHLETVNSRRVGFRYLKVFPASDIVDSKLVSRERKGVESVVDSK